VAGPLVRPRLGRQIAGVCLALAQAYGWDVAVVRIVAVVSLFCSGGIVAVAYLAAWIGIPDEPMDLSGMTGVQQGPPGAYPPRM
jgi:phage shock protein PspC (stress-responsive transcriptional regulator)